jgi:general stress protein YciG
MAANRSSNNNPQGTNQHDQGKGNSQSGNRGNSQSAGGIANRGFASMDPQRQREIASEGGRAAHASGNAHEFTPEEARRAGALSHKNDGNRQSASGGNQGGNRQGGKGVQGGTPEQHAAAGRQSHKNDR